MKLSLKSNHFCVNRFPTLELASWNTYFLEAIRYLKKKKKNPRKQFLSRIFFTLSRATLKRIELSLSTRCSLIINNFRKIKTLEIFLSNVFIRNIHSLLYYIYIYISSHVTFSNSITSKFLKYTSKLSLRYKRLGIFHVRFLE